MQDQKHIIKKQVLEIHVSKDVDAHTIQDEISQLYKDRLVPIINEICNQHSPPGTLHRIDQLNIDLGKVNLDDIEDCFIEKFTEAIRQPHAITAVNIPEEEMTGPDSKSATTPLFAYYLRTGTLPWWTKENSKAYLLQVLDDLNQHPNKLFLQVIRQMCQNEFYLKRFIFTFSDEQIHQTLQGITSFSLTDLPKAQSELIYFIGQKLHLFTKKPTARTIRHQWWVAIARYIPKAIHASDLWKKASYQSLKYLGLDIESTSFDTSFDTSLDTSLDTSADPRLLKFIQLLKPLEPVPQEREKNEIENLLNALRIKHQQNSTVLMFIQEIQRLLIHPSFSKIDLHYLKALKKGIGQLNIPDTKTFIGNLPVQHLEGGAELLSEIETLTKDLHKLFRKLPLSEKRLQKAMESTDQFVGNPVQSSRAFSELIKALTSIDKEIQSTLTAPPSREILEKIKGLEHLLMDVERFSKDKARKHEDFETSVRDLIVALNAIPSQKSRTIRQALRVLEAVMRKPSTEKVAQLMETLIAIHREIQSPLTASTHPEIFEKIKGLERLLKDVEQFSKDEVRKHKDFETRTETLIGEVSAIPSQNIRQTLKALGTLIHKPAKTQDAEKLSEILAQLIMEIKRDKDESTALSQVDVQFLTALEQKNQKLLKYVSARKAKSKNSENHLMSLVTRENLQAISKQVHHLQKQLKQVKIADNDKVIEKLHSSFDDTDPIPVSNAGIVIFWPFLTRLFENLELMKEKSFVNSDSQTKAVAVLQYLASDEEEMFEALLTLNKVLCGVDLVEPLEIVALDTEEKESVEGLLASVISRGPLWKNLSLEGLRKSYLQREGLLRTRDGHWLLQVKKETYDITLERLPWSFNTIKLPWMDEILMVDWL